MTADISLNLSPYDQNNHTHASHLVKVRMLYGVSLKRFVLEYVAIILHVNVMHAGTHKGAEAASWTIRAAQCLTSE